MSSLYRTSSSDSEDCSSLSNNSSSRPTSVESALSSAFDPVRAEAGLRDICNTIGMDYDQCFGRRPNILNGYVPPPPSATASTFDLDLDWPQPPAYPPPPNSVAAWERCHSAQALGSLETRSTSSMYKAFEDDEAATNKDGDTTKQVASRKLGWKSLKRLIPGIFTRPEVSVATRIAPKRSLSLRSFTAKNKLRKTPPCAVFPTVPEFATISDLTGPARPRLQSFTAFAHYADPPSVPAQYHYRVRARVEAEEQNHYRLRAHLDAGEAQAL